MSTYNFIDVTQVAANDLPAEALQLNGEYLEDVIPGYRTLAVSGREALAKELSSFTTGIRNGSTLQSTRFPDRVITVKYQLIAASAEAYREAYNLLAGLLTLDDSELVFNDEPDKFFIGTCSSISIPDAGRNAVTGTIEFTCNDPFKYSIEEHVATPTGAGGVYTWKDDFLTEKYTEGAADADADEVTELIETPSGTYAAYAIGQVLTHKVSDAAVEVTGEDAADFVFGTDYVLDTATNTVYLMADMLADDVQLDGWTYHTADDLLAENTAQFVINYNGTSPAHPELIVDFDDGTENADDGTIENDACGYVAFINEDKRIIQIGDPNEDDVETTRVSGKTTRYTNWNKGKGTGYWASSTIKHHGTGYALGSMGYATWKHASKTGGNKTTKVKGKRKVTVYTNPGSVKFYRPLHYRNSGQAKAPSGEWYGPTIYCKLPNDSAGNSGAKNFTFTWEQLFATTNNKQRGRFDVALVHNDNGTRTVVAAVLISKASDGANAIIHHYVNDTLIEGIDTSVNVQQYNTRFGFSQKLFKKVRDKQGETKKWKKNHKKKKKYKWVYNGWSKPDRVSTIVKNGQTITFDIAGIKHIYRDSTITDTYVNEVFITFGARSGHSAVRFNGLHTAKFFNRTPEVDADIKNTFSIGDEMIADCRDGSITLNNRDVPSLGALGNDWETFALQKGVNNIMVTWSSWATGKPSASIKYREVFI